MNTFVIKPHLLLLCFLPQLNSAFDKPSKHLDDQWKEYKEKYNRTYHSATEKRRRLDWEKNFHKVVKHNDDHAKGKYSYKLKLNHLADLSQKEYIRAIIRLAKSKRKPSSDEITSLQHRNTSRLPSELDWRKEGFITDALNQEDCGSCYAFSIASCIQGQYFKTRKELKDFSTQQLVDCSISNGNLGCAGGSLRNTLKYIQLVGGLMLEDDYPYTAKQGICNYRRSKAVAKIKTWGILPPRDEHSLLVAVTYYGPISVSVNASPATFQLYSSGIYNDPQCSSDFVNHAMLLIGYTKKAWILKNWWSEEWGDNGYMYLERGDNRCAVANYAAYATIV